MITALHTLVYATDPDAARDFFRDVLRFPATDTGGGWLIFRTGPSELGVHPSTWERGAQSGDAQSGDAQSGGAQSGGAQSGGAQSGGAQSGGTDQRFDLSLMCDDLEATMAELEERGAEFEGGVTEQPWGTTVQLLVPGAGTMTLYQPRYDPPALGRSELEAMW
jgi:catechol 2,3-dioxygenase-like lactoylglutathione lyase family enzyme